MLLKITKPDLILEEKAFFFSTILILWVIHIQKKSNTKR